MDLTQRKLNKAEWEGIEVPLGKNEIEILELMKKGYHNVMIKYNKTLSLLDYSKISESDAINMFLYEKYFEKTVKKLCKTYGFDFKIKKSKKYVLKKADQIIINNVYASVSNEKKNIYEFIIIELISKLLKKQTKEST